MKLSKLFKKTAGATSPAYGMATGEGEMGKASRKGLFGALPRMVTKAAQDTARKMPRGEVAYPQEKESSAGLGRFSSRGGEAFRRAAAEAAKKGGKAPAKMAKGGEVLTPAQKRMLQEVQDAKDAKKQEKAYNDSLSSPEMVMPKKSAPKKDSTPVQKRAMGGMMNKKGYAAGGVVKARGMGAASRGGKCKMS